jgi:SnoaL-like domain
MTEDVRSIAATYFRAWKAKDFPTLRSLLADKVTFRGPLGTADDAETCIQGMKTMAQIITDIVIHKTFVDGSDVLTWFDLHTTVAAPCPTANWSQVQNGKITAVRVTFDARLLTGQASDSS